MSNATYLVTKQAQILKIVGEANLSNGLTYHAKAVRSHKSECYFEEIQDSEVEQVHEDNVYIVDTNYWTLRNAVDKVLGF